MQFIGELYNYEHIDSSIIFQTLYLIIVFGHGKPERDQLDPPEDFFRIRLITTLLQTCGRYFDRGSSKRKLHGFLLHFQRYVLSKGPLPLGVEFDVQDLFAHLGSNMTRYSSMEELSVALIELEANKYVASAEKCGSDWHPGSKEQMKQSDYVSFDANRKSLRDRTDENGKDNEEAGSESYSSGSIYQDGHEDTDFPSEGRSNGRPEEDDNGDDSMPIGSDEEIVHVKKEAAQVDPNEQEDFDRGLKALLQESLESRKLELRAKPTLNMVIPMNVFERSKDLRATEPENGGENASVSINDGDGGKVCVKVLVKKGHKQQIKELFIPGDCSLVQSTKQQEAAELEEKQNIKRKKNPRVQ